MRPQGLQLRHVRLDVAPCRIAVAGPELAQGGEETTQVLGSLIVEDVEVERQDRRPFELGRHSTHDDEADTVAEQDPEETEELNAPRLVHAGVRSDRRPNPGGARAAGAG